MSLTSILSIFLILKHFEPDHSYKKYSNKKKHGIIKILIHMGQGLENMVVGLYVVEYTVSKRKQPSHQTDWKMKYVDNTLSPV